jgi:2-amino-4-hydroxy-6-hydroxymethyldihydropteridine diphosphokinase
MSESGCTVEAVSGNYRTAPMGSLVGPSFLNAAARIRADDTPDELLTRLQEIEAEGGRMRHLRWAARTLDLDIILCEEQIVSTPRLQIPHPACWHRRFVLDPLAEISPHAMHPVFHQTLGDLHARLTSRPLPVAYLCYEGAGKLMASMIEGRFPGKTIRVADPRRAAVAFSWRHSASDLPNVIRLDDAEDFAELMTNVLTAALDEPQRVD